MDKPRPGEQQSPKGFLARLDHAAAKMNAFLLVIAIGLGALDFTCFWVLQVRQAIPAMTRVSDGANAARPAAAGIGSAHAAAARPATRSGNAQAAAAPMAQPSATAAGF